MAFGDSPAVELLQNASEKIRAGQADLAHRNRGCRVRRKSVGRKFSRYVPLSRSTRTAGEGRRSNRHAQHARGKRLRHARREDAATEFKILERVALAATDGNHGARRWSAQPIRPSRLRPLSKRQAGGGGPFTDQYRPGHTHTLVSA